MRTNTFQLKAGSSTYMWRAATTDGSDFFAAATAACQPPKKTMRHPTDHIILIKIEKQQANLRDRVQCAISSPLDG